MNRRTFLRTAALSAGVAVAGCLGSDGNANTILSAPDRDHDVDPEDLAYPAYGQELPTVTLPAPLHDRSIETTAFVGERESLVTFVYTRCPGPCPGLTAALGHVQTTARNDGYGDEIAMFPISFDPEHDTAKRMREFSKINGADPTADNWFFLRPETSARANEVVNETFGVGFQQIQRAESPHANQSGPEQGTVLDPGENDETAYTHSNLLLLVNRDGYVERAYHPQPPRPDIVLEDLRAVRDGY